MSLKFVCIVLGLICCLEQLPVKGYPILNIRRLLDPDARYKRVDLAFPQPDHDVIELEQLKEKPILEKVESAIERAMEADAVNHDDTLPALEKQLETITTKTTLINNLGQKELENGGNGHGTATTGDNDSVQSHHRPPTLPHSSGNGQHGNVNHHEPVTSTSNDKLPPSLGKPFYGAARLAFGQNPEVLPTQSTTSTVSSPAVESAIDDLATTLQPAVGLSQLPTSDLQAVPSISLPSDITNDDNKNGKEEIDDSYVAELKATKNAERRSVTVMPPKRAENLLQHTDGQYSSFDLAQYVFWTGDETGVAKAVEEFIQQGLMSRENAIKFLRDIRIGIEYLQDSYANRIYPDQLKSNDDKKSSAFISIPTTTTTSTSTTSTLPPPTTTTTEKQTIKSADRISFKTLGSLPSLMRLKEINNDPNKGNAEFDDAAGRAKIAEFLFAEYSLEEVIYQLAKVMFSQSLAHGSDQAQLTLQRLTAFLEREGERGMISPELQKKILDVLLSALSDTLAERPDLLAAARAKLGSSLNILPGNSIEPIMKH